MRRGDEGAFTELFARHRVSIHRYAAHMAGRDCADDVVQETFLALLRKPDAFRAERGSLQGYLLGIARRQALKRLHGSRVDQWPEDAGVPAGRTGETPFDTVSRAEVVDRVRAAVAALPPVYREAV